MRWFAREKALFLGHASYKLRHLQAPASSIHLPLNQLSQTTKCAKEDLSRAWNWKTKGRSEVSKNLKANGMMKLSVLSALDSEDDPWPGKESMYPAQLEGSWAGRCCHRTQVLKFQSATQVTSMRWKWRRILHKATRAEWTFTFSNSRWSARINVGICRRIGSALKRIPTSS